MHMVKILLFLGLTWPIMTLACSPFFPNWMLDGGNGSVLAAPVARFADEIERMKLGSPQFQAKLASDSYHEQTKDAELADLRRALTRAGVGPVASEKIIQAHDRQRAEVMKLAETREAEQTQANAPLPTDIHILAVLPAPGLPGEFADYFRGATAWHGGDAITARAAWEALLKRPASERLFKSTWAAYMLGRSWEETDSKLSRKYYQQVRVLAGQNFVDSTGLAAASIGREARTHYLEKDWQRAIELYLDQWVAGDPSAMISLRWTASAALNQGSYALCPLAQHAITRRVITAYVIAGGFNKMPIDTDNPIVEAALKTMEKVPAKLVNTTAQKAHRIEDPTLLWLEATESVAVKDLEAAEMLALAAYQAGQPEIAARWLNRAANTPVTQWLRAKLLLRDGHVEQAAALLSKLTRSWPVETNHPANASLPQLMDSLVISQWLPDDNGSGSISPSRQILGEWGALQLARREYTEALDALLRSDFWMDAAYVAERILSLSELQTYVDRHWPVVTLNQTKPAEVSSETQPLTEQADGNIRYLLARRLARLQRYTEARPYYPEEWRRKFDELVTSLTAGTNTTLSTRQRGEALWQAARITRYQGLELLGTEVEPDWRIHGGNYEEGISIQNRLSVFHKGVLPATREEITRAREHHPEPEARWHYRRLASAVAWEAAKLLPNNDDLTARILCEGGSWIKNRNPEEADRFYKALVIRCRKTAIGNEADRRRWFPNLDENGKLMQDPPKSKEEP